MVLVRVREARKERGLTQTQLAERAGVSQTTISQIERGESMPSIAVLVQMAAALGVAPGDLLPDMGEKP